MIGPACKYRLGNSVSCARVNSFKVNLRNLYYKFKKMVPLCSTQLHKLPLWHKVFYNISQ